MNKIILGMVLSTTIALLGAASVFAADVDKTGLVAYRSNSYLKVINDEGKEIASVYDGKLLKISKTLVAYRANSYLIVVNRDGKTIVNQYDGQAPELSNGIATYKQNSYLKAVNYDGVEILSVYDGEIAVPGE